MRRLARCLLAACVLALSANAHADEQQVARGLFDEGVGLMKDGKYADACPKLESSLKHYPGIGTRGKLAECYEKIGRFASAWQLWRDVAQLSARAGEPTREQVASEHAKALEPKLSYVTVTIPAANDVAGLVVKRNGQELDRAKIGSAEPVDSGSIAFEISAPGKKPFSAQVNVAPGQSAKFDVPALESAVTQTAVTPPPSDTTPSYVVETDQPTWKRPVGLALAGVGVVGIGLGAFFGLKAKSTYDGAFDGGGCDKSNKQCDSGGQSSVDDAHSKATVSTILFVAGAACLAGGAFLFFTAPSAKKTGVRIVPGPGGLIVAGSM
ncbi:MAG TPA: hypothetical protein VIF62_11135 [Labilithrix sp.]